MGHYLEGITEQTLPLFVVWGKRGDVLDIVLQTGGGMTTESLLQDHPHLPGGVPGCYIAWELGIRKTDMQGGRRRGFHTD